VGRFHLHYFYPPIKVDKTVEKSKIKDLQYLEHPTWDSHTRLLFELKRELYKDKVWYYLPQILNHIFYFRGKVCSSAMVPKLSQVAPLI
jgi:hypothetical protein